MTYWTNEITPYDDTYMTFDTDTHQYTLTVDGVNKEFNVGLVEFAGSEGNAKQLLREIRGDFYKYVYRVTRRDEQHRRVVEHRLAKDGELRDLIKNSMLDMVRATIRGGYSMQKDLMWANPVTGTVMDLSNVPAIAPDAIEGLQSMGMASRYPYTFQIEDSDYRSGY